MELTDIQAFIESNAGDENVQKYIGGFVTSDRVNTFLESEEGKKILQPKMDKYHSKSLESWKTNNLSKLVDEEFKKKYPEKSEKDRELEQLRAEIELIKTESSRKELTNKALVKAQEKKLPIDLINFFVGADEEITNKNIEAFEKVFSAHIEAAVGERLKGNSSYTPPKGGSGGTFTVEQIAKMTPDEINKHWTEISKITR